MSPAVSFFPVRMSVAIDLRRAMASVRVVAVLVRVLVTLRSAGDVPPWIRQRPFFIAGEAARRG